MSEAEKRETQEAVSDGMPAQVKRVRQAVGLPPSPKPWREKYPEDVLHFVDVLTHDEYAVWAGYCYSKFESGGDIVPRAFLELVLKERDSLVEFSKLVAVEPVTKHHGTFPDPGGCKFGMGLDDPAGLGLADAKADKPVEVHWSGKTEEVELKSVKWDANRVTGISTLSRNLIADGMIDAVAYITHRLGVAAAEERDRMCLIGGGVSQPEGVLARVRPVAVRPGEITYVRCVDAFDALSARRRRKAVWACCDTTWAAILKAKDSTGQPLFRELPPAGVPFELLNRRVVRNDHIPQGALLFGSPSAYTIFDRQKFRVSRPPVGVTIGKVNLFEAHALAISFAEYYDGKLTEDDAWVSVEIQC